MRFLTYLIGFLLVLTGALWVGSFALDDRAAASRTVVIDAPPEAIWPLVADFRAFQSWSPWAERDPDMALTYEGEAGQLGHAMAWRSEQSDVGTGRLEIVEAAAPELMRTALDFGPDGSGEAQISITPVDGGSEVTWSFESALNGPVERWAGLLISGLVGQDYEAGLANLKTVVEAGG